MTNIMAGKTVIVTGGSRGIGKACCLAFAREGANIVFTYNKNKQAADELCLELKKLNVEFLSIQANVREFQKSKIVAEKAVDRFGQIDVLINNAGITRDKALAMMVEEDFRDVVETNLFGVFNMSRAVIIGMVKQKSGRIINVSSVAGLVGIARQTNYCAAKAGIIGFTKSLAKEVAGYGIRVNAVCPGFTDTDMVGAIPENTKKTLLDAIPVKRMGTADEVAGLCVFLASDKAKYIIGETIKIDGGLL